MCRDVFLLLKSESLSVELGVCGGVSYSYTWRPNGWNCPHDIWIYHKSFLL